MGKLDKQTELKRGDIVLIAYGFNKVLNEPFKRIAEFKYWNTSGNPICCPVGEKDTQSSFALDLSKGATVQLATEEDKNNEIWES